MRYYELITETVEDEDYEREVSLGFLSPTNENIAKAKKFLMQKWIDRWRERGALGTEPADLSSSCKFSSLFARAVFGGQLEGNEDHQYVRRGNRVIDLNIDANDVAGMENPHQHDDDWWGNSDHRESLESCKPRVEQWVAEFRASLA